MYKKHVSDISLSDNPWWILLRSWSGMWKFI